MERQRKGGRMTPSTQTRTAAELREEAQVERELARGHINLGKGRTPYSRPSARGYRVSFELAMERRRDANRLLRKARKLEAQS